MSAPKPNFWPQKAKIFRPLGPQKANIGQGWSRVCPKRVGKNGHIEKRTQGIELRHQKDNKAHNTTTPSTHSEVWMRSSLQEVICCPKFPTSTALKKPTCGQRFWISALKKPTLGQGNRQIPVSKSQISGQSLAGASRALVEDMYLIRGPSALRIGMPF